MIKRMIILVENADSYILSRKMPIPPFDIICHIDKKKEGHKDKLLNYWVRP